jgi:transcriptional regulator with XRE-family HTH domain
MATIVKTETFAERLRRLRHERGLSQRNLETPRVSYAYISRLEAGARTPSLTAIRLLAGKLGVTPLFLETGQDTYCPHCGKGMEQK